MNITGETQGEIEGDVTQAGREGSIEVFAVEHQVISPRDAATGLPTGKRQHGAFKVTKAIGKSTPLLYNALTQNENLTDVTIRFWRPDQAGREIHYYTVQLINASITSIRLWKPSTEDPESVRYSDMEEIQFTYQQIIWTFEDGGVTAQDTTGGGGG